MIPERKHVEIESTTTGDEVPFRQPYSVELGDMGSFIVHHGVSVVVGTEQNADSPVRVSLGIAREPCRCGCGKPGIILEFLPQPEHARMLAAQLIDAAAQVEAAAHRAATAALNKAAGR